MANEIHFPVAVIGGGPAGIATAIQLKRFDIEPVIFEPSRLGGLLWNAGSVENYPGIEPGTPGPVLCQRLIRHMETFDIEVLREEVTRLEFHHKRDLFLIKTGSRQYSAHTVVVATGTCAKHDTWDSFVETEPFLKNRIAFEVVALTKEKNTSFIIVGAGDAAFDYALNLTREPTNNAVIIHRGNKTKALPLLIRQAKIQNNIRFMQPYSLTEINKGKNQPLAVTFSSKTAGDSLTLEAHYLIGALGRIPQTGFFTSRLMADRENLIAANRLHLSGDVKNGSRRQTAIATGNGIETAMSIAEGIWSK